MLALTIYLLIRMISSGTIENWGGGGGGPTHLAYLNDFCVISFKLKWQCIRFSKTDRGGKIKLLKMFLK